jgi:hypothetical protein
MCAATRRKKVTTTPFDKVVLMDLDHYHPAGNVMARHGENMPAISG